MRKNQTNRRKFLRSSLLGIGGVTLTPFLRGMPDKENRIAGMKNPGALHVLCVGAHPGDPEFGCGGTIAKYSKSGNAITFLYITRGEAYDLNQSFEKSAAIRTKEAEVSCQILNAKPLFAGQIDAKTVLDKKSIEAVSKLISDQKPDIVFTQWPLDAHPDHQVTGLLTLNAWLRSKKKFHLYFYEVNTGAETMAFHPTEYEDISEVRDIKKQAMFAHRSQEPEKIYDDFFKVMEEFRGLEAGVNAAEAFVYFKPGDERAKVFGF